MLQTLTNNKITQVKIYFLLFQNNKTTQLLTPTKPILVAPSCVK